MVELSVEQLFPERAAMALVIHAMVFAAMVIVVFRVSASWPVARNRAIRRTRRGRHAIGLGLERSLDDLVQFASIEPDTPAGGAVVDLDTLALGHHKLKVLAYWAEHRCILSSIASSYPHEGAARAATHVLPIRPR
jgi:hypothetical protein